MRCRDADEGVALITVMVALVVVAVLGVTISSVAVTRASQVGIRDRSNDTFGAAEGSLDRYRSKLIDNPYYHLHHVDAFERTRRCTDDTSASFGLTFAPGALDPAGLQTDWPRDCSTWDYVGPDTTWLVADGIGRRIEVRPVDGGGVTIRSVAVGPDGLARTIEATYERRTIGDFMLLASGDTLKTSTDNTTYTGRFYGLGNCELSGKNTVAYDDYWCEGKLKFPDGGPFLHPRKNNISFVSPAWCYDGDGSGTIGSKDCGNIRDVLDEPINFNGFWDDLEGLRFAACESGGLCLDSGAELTTTTGATVTMPDLDDDAWVRLVFVGPGDHSAPEPAIEVWTTGHRNQADAPDAEDRYNKGKKWTHTLGTWRDAATPAAGDGVNGAWTLVSNRVAYPSNGAIYTPFHVAAGWCDKASMTGPCRRGGGSLEVPFGLYAGDSTATGARHIVFLDSFVRAPGAEATAVFMASGSTFVSRAAYPAPGGEFRLEAAVVTQGAHKGDSDRMTLMTPCYGKGKDSPGVDWRFLGLHSGSADIAVEWDDKKEFECVRGARVLEQGYDPLLRQFPPPWIPTVDGDGWGLTQWREVSAPDWAAGYLP